MSRRYTIVEPAQRILFRYRNDTKIFVYSHELKRSKSKTLLRNVTRKLSKCYYIVQMSLKVEVLMGKVVASRFEKVSDFRGLLVDGSVPIFSLREASFTKVARRFERSLIPYKFLGTSHESEFPIILLEF